MTVRRDTGLDVAAGSLAGLHASSLAGRRRRHSSRRPGRTLLSTRLAVLALAAIAVATASDGAASSSISSASAASSSPPQSITSISHTTHAQELREGAGPGSSGHSTHTTTTTSTTTDVHTTTSLAVETTQPITHDESLSVTVSTCASASINYITQRLPSQCWRSTKAEPTPDAAGASTTRADLAPSVVEASDSGLSSILTATIALATPSNGVDLVPVTEIVLEQDSPLDNANFLSFEDWKRQNLPPAQQRAPAVDRPRPDTKNRDSLENSLDGLGDDGEIILDFSGFGAAVSQPTQPTVSDQAVHSQDGGQRRRPKDAGKTCKERSNYASIDCGANVLKANPQANKASSILFENKDSYMLNECSSDNKFFIVEMCDEVKIDTIVLANFEFFSSMFRTFRISVSDRYPVKMEKWQHVGTFEARNARDLQAFLVEDHTGFARYVRVEMVTHYGSEFYCPVSLFRVHGMTAFEEYKLEQLAAEGGDDEDEPLEAEATSEPTPAVQVVPAEAEPVEEPSSSASAAKSDDAALSPPLSAPPASTQTEEAKEPDSTSLVETPASGSASGSASVLGNGNSSTIANETQSASESTTETLHSATFVAETDAPEANSTASTASTASAATFTNTASRSQARSSPSSSQTPPNPSQPTQPSQPASQDSFFKSINKRLQFLESNSTLSLQYIESQSALLRDAFATVERRQLAKTTAFLSVLNATVLAELARFQTEYESLWQSTLMELASQRDQGRRERDLLGERVRMLADEVVSQKRLLAAQATILLVCLGLVVFARSSAASAVTESSLLAGMQELLARGREGPKQKAAHRPASWMARYSPASPVSPASPESGPRPHTAGPTSAALGHRPGGSLQLQLSGGAGDDLISPVSPHSAGSGVSPVSAVSAVSPASPHSPVSAASLQREPPHDEHEHGQHHEHEHGHELEHAAAHDSPSSASGSLSGKPIGTDYSTAHDYDARPAALAVTQSAPTTPVADEGEPEPEREPAPAPGQTSARPFEPPSSA